MTEWPLLRTLTPEDRRALLAAGRKRRYARRDIVFHEGDPGDALHLVERGHVVVRMTTARGDVVTLTVIGPGGTFGELPLLDGSATRTATVVALEPTETWSLHRDQFETLRQSNPGVDRFLIELLAGYVRRLSSQVVEALHLPADKRVARRLHALATDYGQPAASIPVTQEDLASLAGTSRATVNRVLGELEAAGAVAVARGRISVLDPDRLDRAARP